MRFRPGLTGIIGPNGAGKSTILEAIAWTVYGA
ncbi:MAG: ATP-binding protein, partial [Gemmatimonadetes bacterium]|nr:ATP-binding protein [Gemmatimonadota bacterium]